MIESTTETFNRDSGVLHMTEAKIDKPEFLSMLQSLGFPAVEGHSWSIRDNGKQIVILSNGVVPYEAEDEDLEYEC